MPHSKISDPSNGSCTACRRPLLRPGYRVRLGERLVVKCLRCALFDRRLLKQAAKVSLIVGTALVLLNQGDLIFQGTFDWKLGYPKVLLTYLVPLLVSTYSALANAHLPPPSPLQEDTD